MDRRSMIDSVTAEVLRRLTAVSAQAEGIAVGGAWPGWQTYSQDLCAAEQKQALIVQLEPWAMVRLAQGNGGNASEQFLLEMLLLGRPVFLAPQALCYHRYCDTAPEALYRQYVASEKALLTMGVRPLSAPVQPAAAKSHLLTEADVQSLLVRGETLLHVGTNTIITPLAADALKAAQITVLREEREAKPWS